MSLNEFIDKTGVANLARMLQCTEASIYQWRSGKAAPRPETAYILTVISHRQLTLEAVFMPYIERQLNGTKFAIGSIDGKTTNQLQFNFDKN